jgi:hypothetical protein
MAKAKIKLNARGFEQIRRSPAAVALLTRTVQATADAAGEGYEGYVYQGIPGKTYGRAIGHVTTSNFKAILNNARHNTLMRVFDRLGG